MNLFIFQDQAAYNKLLKLYLESLSESEREERIYTLNYKANPTSNKQKKNPRVSMFYLKMTNGQTCTLFLFKNKKQEIYIYLVTSLHHTQDNFWLGYVWFEF